MKKIFIVDLRGLNSQKFDANKIVEAIKGRIMEFDSDNTRSYWFSRADLRSHLGNEEVILETPTSDDPSNKEVAPILDWISNAASNGFAGSDFRVLTYDTNLMRQVTRLESASLSIVPLHIRNFVSDNVHGPVETHRPMPVATVPVTATLQGPEMTLDQAAKTAMNAMIKNGITSPLRAVPMAQFRALLEREDPAASKLRAPHLLMSSVARRCDELGWLTRDVRKQGNGTETYMYLRPEALTNLVAAPVLAAAPRAATAVPATKVVADGETTNDKSETIVYEIAWMEKVLKDLGVYCPPVYRQQFFTAVQEILATPNNQTTLPVLRKQALDIVRQRMPAIPNKNPVEQDKYWHIISSAFMKNALLAGVLHDASGRPIPTGIGKDSTLIAGCDPNIRDRCEAYLVELIVKAMPQGCIFLNFNRLSLSLWQQGGSNPVPTEKLQGDLDRLLSMLVNEQRIKEGAGGERILVNSMPSVRSSDIA